MYEDFYRLTGAPFHITPDPEFLYLSPSHKEALASIAYGVEQRKGFIVVLGEVGLGKTTVLRAYVSALDRRRTALIYVFNANVSFKGLLDAIYSELGIPAARDDVQGMVDGLHHVLIEQHRQGHNVVLIVDEAQNMPVKTLENLRVLSNLETSTEKLLQIVLVGQPEFAEKLDLHELRQLKQRIAVRCALSPFTKKESFAYIEHRLNRVGASSSSVFTPSAIRMLVKRAGGVARTLNILCDNALVTGLGYQKRPVTKSIVREVIGDLAGAVRASRARKIMVPAAALILIGTSTAAIPYLKPLWPAPEAVLSIVAPQPPTLKLPTAVSPHPAAVSARSDDIDYLESLQSVLPDVPTQTSNQTFVATRVVQEGEPLSRMAVEVYGSSDVQVIQRIMESNPVITDANRIMAGTSIRFPDVSDLRAKELRPPTEAH